MQGILRQLQDGLLGPRSGLGAFARNLLFFPAFRPIAGEGPAL
jgi:hypothetical protein